MMGKTQRLEQQRVEKRHLLSLSLSFLEVLMQTMKECENLSQLLRLMMSE